MPLVLLVLLLAELLTVAYVVVDIHLIREWYHWKDVYDHHDYAMRCLYGAIALSAFMLLGKAPIKWLVSKNRKNEDEPKQEHSQDQQQLNRPDGSVINIEFAGNSNGQPLLFVHGWNEKSTAWYYQKKHFAQKYRLILIDLPGLGKSKKPNNNDFSLQKMAADLEAVIEHLSLTNVILWGHSIGGMVILTYFTQTGKNVSAKIKGIILQHTTFLNPTHTSILNGLLRTIQKPVLYPICYLMIALWPVFWLSKWMSYLNGNMLLSTRFLTFAGTQTPSQLDFIARLSAMAPPNVFARGMLGMMKTYDVTNDLPYINVPTLIFGATSDRLTKLNASIYMQKNIPDARLVSLSPAGHQGLIERHDETNSAAESFIKSIQ